MNKFASYISFSDFMTEYGKTLKFNLHFQICHAFLSPWEMWWNIGLILPKQSPFESL